MCMLSLTLWKDFRAKEQTQRTLFQGEPQSCLVHLFTVWQFYNFSTCTCNLVYTVLCLLLLPVQVCTFLIQAGIKTRLRVTPLHAFNKRGWGGANKQLCCHDLMIAARYDGSNIQNVVASGFSSEKGYLFSTTCQLVEGQWTPLSAQGKRQSRAGSRVTEKKGCSVT